MPPCGARDKPLPSTGHGGCRSSAELSGPRWLVALSHLHPNPLLFCKTLVLRSGHVCFQCLKLFGSGWCEIFGHCLSSSRPWCVIFSGKMHCDYSNPAPNNWVCTPHGPPALCSHRFDFIYDLFEHVSSRTNQDTLKCGSKHRRPTVSSQFKVSLRCWPGRIHLYCDFKN